MIPARRALALFAKNPVAAAVKTRLVPPLTYPQAAELATAFLADSSAGLVLAARAVRAKPCVFYYPDSAYAAIRRHIPEGVATYPQVGGDLGERLASAYATLANESLTDVCFIGADSPTLPHAYISAAFAALAAESETTLGRATDGGYYLIGLRSAHPELFERIDWSTNRVFAQTCERIAEHGLTLEVLPAWYDVDDASGLARLRAELLAPESLVARGEPAPRTEALLSSMASDRMP